MKNKFIYIIILLLLFLLVYFLNSKQAKTFQWRPTYSQYDKQPFGGHAFEQLLQKSWEKPYTHSYKNVRRLINEGSLTNENILIICNYFNAESEEIDKILDYAGEGHTIMIVCTIVDYYLTDSLSILPNNEHFYNHFAIQQNSDTLKESQDLRLCSPSFQGKKYTFPKMISNCYYDSIPKNCQVLAVNEKSQPIAISCPIGEGAIIFFCNPTIFTNYGILSQNDEFIWGLLSYLDGAPLLRTEFYEVGSQESDSPFRYLLTIPALSWALYITLLVLLIFMIFTAKRKQRVIPVIKDPDNHLLKFVRSLSALYLRKSDNSDILHKKYSLFGEQLHKLYGIDIINKPHNSELFHRIASKTGYSPEEVSNLFKSLELIDSDFPISDKMLIELVIKMDQMIKT